MIGSTKTSISAAYLTDYGVGLDVKERCTTLNAVLALCDY